MEPSDYDFYPENIVIDEAEEAQFIQEYLSANGKEAVSISQIRDVIDAQLEFLKAKGIAFDFGDEDAS